MIGAVESMRQSAAARILHDVIAALTIGYNLLVGAMSVLAAI